ncbi:MAG: glycosyltransferase family 4 protein, partial [Ignavibacteriaceae bacterium]
VEFTGRIPSEKVAAYYNQMDVAVFLSKNESFGVAVLEASACGLPVVVSDVGGLPEVVENNITGLIVEKENHLAAAEAIEKLLLEPDLRNKMGANGRKRVEKFYNWDDCVDQMINIYSDILNG